MLSLLRESASNLWQVMGTVQHNKYAHARIQVNEKPETTWEKAKKLGLIIICSVYTHGLAPLVSSLNSGRIYLWDKASACWHRNGAPVVESETSPDQPKSWLAWMFGN